MPVSVAAPKTREVEVLGLCVRTGLGLNYDCLYGSSALVSRLLSSCKSVSDGRTSTPD